MKLALATVAIVVGALAGCAQYPTQANVQTFEIVAEGKYLPVDQARFADCLFDGWDEVENYTAPSQARLTKRTNGYRVDAISLSNKLIAADLRDDGTFTLSRMKVKKMMTTLEREAAAADACIKTFSR